MTDIEAREDFVNNSDSKDIDTKPPSGVVSITTAMSQGYIGGYGSKGRNVFKNPSSSGFTSGLVIGTSHIELPHTPGVSYTRSP